MTRTLFITAILAIALFCLTHCTRSDNQSSSPKVKKLGFVLATLNEERYEKDRRYFEEAAKAAGASVEFAACDDKAAVQTSKVETLLAKGVDVLVIQPVNGNAAASVVRMAKQEGVPVVAYDRLIKNADIDAYVTQNSFHVGVLQAEEAVRRTNGKGNVVILMGEAGHSVADQITEGNLSVLKKHPDMKVVVKQNHPGWSSSLALATIENALTRYKNKIDVILANNDGMALGATQALEEQKLTGKVFVAGADADIAAVRNIVSGKQTMTVLKGIRPLAETAVKVGLHLANQESFVSDGEIANGAKKVPVINTPVFRVAKDNLDTQVIEYGFHTRQDVFGAE